LVRGARRVDEDVDHFSRIGAAALEVLFGIDAERLRTYANPTDTDKARRRRSAGRSRNFLSCHFLHA
jgi:hypothetical protein